MSNKINQKRTGRNVAKKAAIILQDNEASIISKQLAGSVLSQTNTKNQTGEEMETIASKVLKSKKYSKETKELAASLLSQSNKKR